MPLKLLHEQPLQNLNGWARIKTAILDLQSDLHVLPTTLLSLAIEIMLPIKEKLKEFVILSFTLLDNFSVHSNDSCC